MAGDKGKNKKAKKVRLAINTTSYGVSEWAERFNTTPAKFTKLMREIKVNSKKIYQVLIKRKATQLN